MSVVDEPRKLGLIPSPPRDLKRRLMLANYAAALPDPPPVVNGYRRLTRFPKFGNDQYGDCGFASASQLRQVWTFNDADTPDVLNSDADTIRAYLAYTGGRDDGSVLTEVLKLWQHSGICGQRIEGYVGVDPNDHREIQQAIAIFGGLYTGFTLPAGWFDDMSHWTLANSHTRMIGGHSVAICSYDQRQRTYGVYTWGKIVPMDFDALPQFFTELYAVLAGDWYGPDGICPNGLDVKALREDLEAIGR